MLYTFGFYGSGDEPVPFMTDEGGTVRVSHGHDGLQGEGRVAAAGGDALYEVFAHDTTLRLCRELTLRVLGPRRPPTKPNP